MRLSQHLEFIGFVLARSGVLRDPRSSIGRSLFRAWPETSGPEDTAQSSPRLMTRGLAPLLPVEFHKMGSFRRPRPRFMSSPVLSELPRFQAAQQALQLSSNSAWNSVQTAVINVFKGGGLQSNELYALNENI
ncbi:hypothetical protein U0070_024315, partial [Myodes glareolus]